MLLLSALSIGAIGKIVDVMCQALFRMYLSQLNYHNGTVKKVASLQIRKLRQVGLHRASKWEGI